MSLQFVLYIFRTYYASSTSFGATTNSLAWLCCSRSWDVSYSSVVLRVETIRMPRAEGGGPLGGAIAATVGWRRGVVDSGVEIILKM